MYKYPKIVKRQGSQAIEENTTSLPRASSLAQPPEAIELPKAPYSEQSIESVEMPPPAERWEALDGKLSNSSLYQSDMSGSRKVIVKTQLAVVHQEWNQTKLRIELALRLNVQVPDSLAASVHPEKQNSLPSITPSQTATTVQSDWVLDYGRAEKWEWCSPATQLLVPFGAGALSTCITATVDPNCTESSPSECLKVLALCVCCTLESTANRSVVRPRHTAKMQL